MVHVPMGIFRSVQRPTYDDLVRAQVQGAVADAGDAGDEDLARLLHGKDTWTVEA
jgi:2-oxoglutarate ferredoxin oxidoreductase subunit beta